MLRIAAIVTGAALAIVVLAGFIYAVTDHPGPRHTITETRTVTAPVRTLVLRSQAGDIELVPGRRLVLHETHHYRGSNKPDVTQRVDADRLTVEDHACEGNDDCSTDFRLEVPALTTVQVKTAAGNVRATGLDAAEVRAETNAGDVELDLAREPNRVAARSDAGNLVIDVPFGTYAVTTHTNAGDDSVGGIVNDPRAANRIDMRTQAGNIVVRAR